MWQIAVSLCAWHLAAIGQSVAIYRELCPQAASPNAKLCLPSFRQADWLCAPEQEFDGGSRGNPGPAGAGAALYEVRRNSLVRSCSWFTCTHAVTALGAFTSARHEQP